MNDMLQSHVAIIQFIISDAIWFSVHTPVAALLEITSQNRTLKFQSPTHVLCVAPALTINHLVTCSKIGKFDECLNFVIKTRFFPQENVLLGSDYPFPLGEHHPGKLIEEVYKDNAELKVRYGNAQKWKYIVCLK